MARSVSEGKSSCSSARTAISTTPFTRCRSLRVVPPRIDFWKCRSFVGHALGMPSSVPRSTRATEISGWHRIEAAPINLHRTAAILWLRHPDIVPMSAPPRIEACSSWVARQERSDGRGLPVLPFASQWPEASARGSDRTVLSLGHRKMRHALHSLSLAQGRGTQQADFTTSGYASRRTTATRRIAPGAGTPPPECSPTACCESPSPVQRPGSQTTS